MATTKDVIQGFISGDDKGKASGGRLFIEDGKLINYGTVIAQRSNEGLIINATKYSMTTTKHQNVLLNSAYGIVTTVVDVPMGASDLEPYAKQEA